MRVQRSCLRSLRNIWKWIRRRGIFVILGACFVMLWLIVANKAAPVVMYSYCEPIDVVYTWVNGSDPAFIESVRRFDPAYDPTRFDDKNELRYSLRSLELYAPWVRHVYIVTNGQIPYWLDLSYEGVTIVPHEVLTPHPEMLPTFSSAAIETFIHRIPNLSARFLYMNDDIFLGAPLYPEDLYTESEGVHIYQTWMVPDCADDCPWTYIGDGICDRSCNIAECQHDGGDCEGELYHTSDGIGVGQKTQQPLKPLKESESVHAEIRTFPGRKKFRKLKHLRGHASQFRELVRHRNVSTLNELRLIVDDYNNARRSQSYAESLPTLTTTTLPAMENTSPRITAPVETKSTKDIYSQSLLYTNMLLNRHYGFKVRNVPAHVGFLLERRIIEAMQTKFADEVRATAFKRFRAGDDLQFAFSYYAFIMGETRNRSVGEIFDEFDTDQSLTWSDREVRTFLARMYPLPLDWSAVHFFEEVISNCSRDLGFDKRAGEVVYTTLVYERYEDSNVPTISRDLVANCTLLAEALISNFGTRPKYKYNALPKSAVHSNFMMLTSDVNEVVNGFDKIRRQLRKFNCINDNLRPEQVEDNQLIRHLLEDFYLSFFPRRSRYELQAEYRNRYTNWHDYQRWRRRKRAALVVGYMATVILILFIARFVCIHKAKFARRYVQRF